MRKWMACVALLLALLIAMPGAAVAELDELQQMLDELDPAGGDGQGGDASGLDELQQMLDGLDDTGGDASGPDEPEDAGDEAPRTDGVSQSEYPLLEGYDLTSLNDTVALQVPGGWGNNLGASEMMVSYSPANNSGATDPSSSTLSTIWYGVGASGSAVLDEYVDNIRKEYIFSDVQSSPFTVAGQPGVALSYVMSVGTNSFDCRSACFVYGDTLYTVEMYQGRASASDYFPVYENVIGSEAIMAGEWEFRTARPDGTPEPTQAPVAPPVDTPTEAPPEPAPTAAPQLTPIAGDLGEFTYAINGHTYGFPTAVRDLAEGDLGLDMTLELSYERSPREAGDALINTLYFVLDHFPARELVGVSNLTGGNAPMNAGILTALVDTRAATVSVELPGGVRVGGAEALVAAAFPEFAGRALDGLADFRGNELLYACNVRDDGCNGYVIIRNDAPYCSALSIICEEGTIREINFQCLGEAVAEGIFA